MEKGRETGRATLRRLQWDRAQQGSDLGHPGTRAHTAPAKSVPATLTPIIRWTKSTDFTLIVISTRFVEPGAEQYTDKAAEEGKRQIEHAIPCRAALKIYSFHMRGIGHDLGFNPSVYTPELAEEICARLSAGKSLQVDMPRSRHAAV